jgi:multiple sugar transport system permease protein
MSSSNHASSNLSVPDIVILVSAAVMAFAFTQLMWVQTADLSATGLALLNPVQLGLPNSLRLSLPWLLPIAIAVGGVGALIAMFVPRIRSAGVVTAMFGGVIGLLYFLLFFMQNSRSFSDIGNVTGVLGLGFWLALAGTALLIVQGALPRQSTSARNWSRYTPYLFLAVPLMIYFMWIIYPMLYSVYLSFTDWDGISPNPNLVGFANYQRLFGDRDFGISFGNNVRWIVVFLTVPTTIGLALALIFNSNIRGARWFKVSFYAPLILSFVVIGTIWSWIYEPRSGLINSLITGVFGVARGPGWLADRNQALWAILGAAVWRQVGYVMILYLAGLKNLDPSLVEAARVDGANGWALFRKVIFPLLGPITTVVLVISVIDSLRAFDLVQVMTRGGPGGASNVLANFMYIEAFNNYRYSYGATIAVTLLALSLIIIIPYLYRSAKTEIEY